MNKIAPKIELVLDIANHVGETPVWSEKEKALYWINCEHEPELLRWDPKSGAVKRWPMPERIGGFVFKKTGGAMITLKTGLYDFDFNTAKLALRVPTPLPDHVALHECMCDPTGRFWVGAIDQRVGPGNLHPQGGTFFRLEGNELIPMVDKITCANGLGFSPDGRTLYLADSTTARCDQWDLDPKTGAISNRRTFFQLEPGVGFLDGATVDKAGGYWATLVYGSKLRRYLPDGTIDREVALPVENPTKVAFGGDNMATLYVTTSNMPLGDQKLSPHSGGIFAFTPEVGGIPDAFLPS